MSNPTYNKWKSTTIYGELKVRDLTNSTGTSVVETAYTDISGNVFLRNNLDVSGNATFTNAITCNGTITNSTDLATKSYVDSAVSGGGGSSILGTNNNWTGTNTYNTYLPTSTQTPTNSNDLTTKTYVDSGISGLSSVYQSISGMSSYLTTATASSTYQTITDASNNYLKIVDASNNYVKLSGNNTITGNNTFSNTITCNGTITNSNDLTTKNYVDTAVAGVGGGASLTTDQTFTGVNSFSQPILSTIPNYKIGTNATIDYTPFNTPYTDISVNTISAGYYDYPVTSNFDFDIAVTDTITLQTKSYKTINININMSYFFDFTFAGTTIATTHTGAFTLSTIYFDVYINGTLNQTITATKVNTITTMTNTFTLSAPCTYRVKGFITNLTGTFDLPFLTTSQNCYIKVRGTMPITLDRTSGGLNDRFATFSITPTIIFNTRYLNYTKLLSGTNPTITTAISSNTNYSASYVNFNFKDITNINASYFDDVRCGGSLTSVDLFTNNINANSVNFTSSLNPSTSNTYAFNFPSGSSTYNFSGSGQSTISEILILSQSNTNQQLSSAFTIPKNWEGTIRFIVPVTYNLYCSLNITANTGGNAFQYYHTPTNINLQFKLTNGTKVFYDGLATARYDFPTTSVGFNWSYNTAITGTSIIDYSQFVGYYVLDVFIPYTLQQYTNVILYNVPTDTNYSATFIKSPNNTAGFNFTYTGSITTSMTTNTTLRSFTSSTSGTAAILSITYPTTPTNNFNTTATNSDMVLLQYNNSSTSGTTYTNILRANQLILNSSIANTQAFAYTNPNQVGYSIHFTSTLSTSITGTGNYVNLTTFRIPLDCGAGMFLVNYRIHLIPTGALANGRCYVRLVSNTAGSANPFQQLNILVRNTTANIEQTANGSYIFYSNPAIPSNYIQIDTNITNGQSWSLQPLLTYSISMLATRIA